MTASSAEVTTGTGETKEDDSSRRNPATESNDKEYTELHLPYKDEDEQQQAGRKESKPIQQRTGMFSCIGRCWNSFYDRWPRTHAILHRQILVYSLLLVTLLGGFALSKLESPYEVAQNDYFLQRVWQLNAIPIQQATEALIGLPTACLIEYTKKMEQSVDPNATSSTTKPFEYVHTPTTPNENTETYGFETDPARMYLGSIFPSGYSFLTNSSASAEDMVRLINETFPNTDIFLPTFPSELPLPGLPENASDDTNNTMASDIDFVAIYTSQGLYDYMVACEQLAGELLAAIVNFTFEIARKDFQLLTGSDAGAAGLAFNWNRCWNDTELGFSDPFLPTQKQIEASQYKNQTNYYTNQWNADREELFANYSTEMGCSEIDPNNGTAVIERTKCYWNATKHSVLNATGAKGCRTNTGSAAWFWFTIMTTVGYGNFSPNTEGGRLLVWCLGWLSIIGFGGIMILAGTTYVAIVDDVSRRFNIKWLQHPLYSTILWGVVSAIWLVIVAYKARRFWDNRTPDFEYTLGDSYWFSYISVLTVGLGDFVLQPQGIFVCDLFQWTSLLLHGFVFITSFLGKVGDLLQSFLPKNRESFEYHLARTDIFGSGYNTPISKSLETLKEMVEEMEDETLVSNSILGKNDKTNYRTSFVGNEKALAPDGNTINYHRIRILLEKKNLLIQLLEATQSELENRVDESLLNLRQHPEGIIVDPLANDTPLAFRKAAESLTTVEELQYEEGVLESALKRTKAVRTHLESFRAADSIENAC